jgi:hypothetical protein
MQGAPIRERVHELACGSDAWMQTERVRSFAYEVEVSGGDDTLDVSAGEAAPHRVGVPPSALRTAADTASAVLAQHRKEKPGG